MKVDLENMSIESLKEIIRSKEKEQELENYCVGSYQNVEYNPTLHNLVFKNNCMITTLLQGDGVLIEKSEIKAILRDNEGIKVILKGSTRDLSDYEILWRND